MRLFNHLHNVGFNLVVEKKSISSKYLSLEIVENIYFRVYIEFVILKKARGGGIISLHFPHIFPQLISTLSRPFGKIFCDVNVASFQQVSFP